MAKIARYIGANKMNKKWDFYFYFVFGFFVFSFFMFWFWGFRFFVLFIFYVGFFVYFLFFMLGFVLCFLYFAGFTGFAYNTTIAIAVAVANDRRAFIVFAIFLQYLMRDFRIL